MPIPAPTPMTEAEIEAAAWADPDARPFHARRAGEGPAGAAHQDVAARARPDPGRIRRALPHPRRHPGLTDARVARSPTSRPVPPPCHRQRRPTREACAARWRKSSRAAGGAACTNPCLILPQRACLAQRGDVVCGEIGTSGGWRRCFDAEGGGGGGGAAEASAPREAGRNPSPCGTQKPRSFRWSLSTRSAELARAAGIPVGLRRRRRRRRVAGAARRRGRRRSRRGVPGARRDRTRPAPSVRDDAHRLCHSASLVTARLSQSSAPAQR